MTRSLSSPPRRVRLRGNYRFTRMLLLVLAVGIPCAALFFGLREAAEMRRLAEKGVTTRAVVEGKRIRKGSKGGKRYVVRYRFDANGGPRRGSDRVSRGTWRRLETGDPVPVTFLPSEPTVNCVGTVTIAMAESKARRFWIVAGVVALGFGIAIFFCERTWRRFVLLLREGRAVDAEVLEYTLAAKKKQKHRLRYRFRTPGGGTIESEDRLQNAPDPRPEAGDTIVVLQDRGDKGNHASLPRVLEFARLHETR